MAAAVAAALSSSNSMALCSTPNIKQNQKKIHKNSNKNNFK
jgi:hypothetical protein